MIALSLLWVLPPLAVEFLASRRRVHLRRVQRLVAAINKGGVYGEGADALWRSMYSRVWESHRLELGSCHEHAIGWLDIFTNVSAPLLGGVAAAAAPAAAAPYRTVVQRQWHAGAYNAADAMSSHTFGELSSKIRSYILGADGARRGGGAAAAVTAAVDVQWVRGFYEASLTPALARRMRPALYVDFDCDLYSSTYHALDWLATHGLLEAGTILGYDDWSTGGAGGQQRAHAELTAKHYMLVRQLQPLDGHTVRQPCFEIVSIGMLPYYWALLKKRLGWGPPGTGDAAVAIKAARPATPRGAGAPASAGE